MKLFKKAKKGFTLIELVVVIAVIAVLSAVAVVSYISITNRAKESNDHMVIDQINTSLLSSQILEKKATVHEIVERFDEEEGYDVRTIKPELKDARFVYSYEKGKFGYWKDNKVAYPDDLAKIDFTGSNDLWFFEDEAKATYTDSYSHYLEAAGNVTEITTNGGLDVGECKTISSIIFNRTTKALKDIVIRTNSANTTLIIDDASTGTIYHYGSSGALNIIQCHTDSYHENGTVGFAEIAKGRIVLESGSEIKHIHVNAKEDGSGNSLNEFDTVIIKDNGAKALPEAITRDQVDVSEAKPVVTVESGSTSETVYVYPYTDSESTKTGTTEQTTTQNTAIATDLGKLVLDNGSDAGEKAMSNNEKAETKTELVNEAKAPEIAKELEEETTAVVYNLNTGVSYENLYSAIEEAPDNAKTTLVLLKNVSNTANSNYTIPASKNIVLDLNGKTISTYAPDEEKSYTIVNYGTLTIKDNTDASKNGSGSGKIVSTVNKADMADVPGYASNTITNSGKLTIESGLIENKGAGYACFAIDNQTNGTLYTPELIINGGKMLQESASHYAVRMFCNSTTNVNKVIVNGGIIEGGYAFWMQTPNNKANQAELVINGGEFIAHDGYAVFIGGSGSTTDGRQYSNASVIINGGTLNRVMMGGVSSAEKGPKTFEINGGRIVELALGSNLSPIIRGGVYNSTIICTWGYVYIVDGDVYVENSNGTKGEKYEAPFDKKSYWEDNGYSFEYDSHYQDYVVKVAKSINDIIGDYLDSDYKLVDNGNGTSSVVHK